MDPHGGSVQTHMVSDKASRRSADMVVKDIPDSEITSLDPLEGPGIGRGVGGRIFGCVL